MNWRVVARPEVEEDVAEAAEWYDAQQAGLGGQFREEVIQVFEALAVTGAGVRTSAGMSLLPGNITAEIEAVFEMA